MYMTFESLVSTLFLFNCLIDFCPDALINCIFIVFD